jgi:filamentous hemagglutinin family protein
MAINLEGQITANKVNETDGRVFLMADTGSIQVSGIIEGDNTIDVIAGELLLVEGGAITTYTGSIGSDLRIEVGELSLVSSAIITDGNLTNLSGGDITFLGGDFIIDESLVSLSGGNLSHSFETFNISQGGSATFNESTTITNILDRVTSNDSSQISGTLSSEYSGADLYFLNPSGTGNSGLELTSGTGNSGLELTSGTGNSGLELTSGTSNSGTILATSVTTISDSSSNALNTIFQPIIFLTGTDGYLNSRLFSNTKSNRSVVQHTNDQLLQEDGSGNLLADFSIRAEEDSRSIINLDK